MSVAIRTAPVNDAGADVSKADFWGAIDHPDLDIQKLPAKKFQRTKAGAQKFLAWLAKQVAPGVGLRIIMEATGLYSEQLAEWLLELDPNCRVVIANPHSVSKFTSSHTDTKTDASDSRCLARYGHGRRLKDYVPVPADRRPLRTMVRQRKELVSRLSAERQRLKEYEGLSEIVTESQKRVVAFLLQEKKQLECEIRKVIQSHEGLKKIAASVRQICGVGETIAAVVVAEFGDLSGFSSHKELVAFVGLKPREYSSGTSVKKRTRMSKRGPRYIRALLYIAAMTAIKQGKNRFARQYHELVGRGLNGKAAIGAIMRKILVVIRVLIITGKPYDDTHTPSCAKAVDKGGKAVNSCGKGEAA